MLCLSILRTNGFVASSETIRIIVVNNESPDRDKGSGEGVDLVSRYMYVTERNKYKLSISSQAFYLTELIYCFAALVTLLVNDTNSDQRNTTVAVLGKGSSFGVCTNFFSLLFSVIHEAYEGM